MLVDDEARIVQGLQRALRMFRESWDVVTATSGPAALQLFEAQPIDVIITDMRMPQMDGARLLAEVKSRFPSAMRIVLSGQTDAEAAFRALPVAHQFLSKPTDPLAIGELLLRTSMMKDALPDPSIHAALGALDALPSPRAIREELTRAISVGAPADTLVGIVERDPALVLKLLQTVNSAFFGLRRRICDIGEAIAYLGVDLVKAVCAIGGTTELPPRVRPVALANLARRIAGGEELGAIAFAAALFLELGRFATSLSSTALPIEQEMPIAAYLLDLWGIPRVVVEALLEQRTIGSTIGTRTKLMPADAVWIAQRLMDGQPVNTEYLERLGVTLPQAA